MTSIPDDLDALVDTTEAAAIAKVRTPTIRSWKRRGQLKAGGLDERGRPLYRVIDVLRAEASTRRRTSNPHRGALQCNTPASGRPMPPARR